MASRTEYRIFKSEVRASKGDKPQIGGYAAVFNTETDLGYVREKIAPGAFKNAIQEGQDVKCLFNHDPNKVLGRTKNGTLRLSEDNTGLKYDCDIDKSTSVGKDVHAHISRGDIDQCSFGFVVRDEEVNYDNDGIPHRTIKQADLFDVSPVTYPAYPTTSVEARSNAEALRKFKTPTTDPDEEGANDDGVPDAPAECACRCRACFDADCRECDLHINDCQADNCDHEDGSDDLEDPSDNNADGNDDERSAKRAAAKTLKVDGEELTAGDFLYVGDPDETSTWALPWKFSSAAKTKSHLRNALARFNQTKTIPASEKPAVYKKLVAKCKQYGIDVDEEKKSVEIDLETAKRRTYLNELSLTL
jgi:Escherichia/Staphylococcus phage prohead protease